MAEWNPEEWKIKVRPLTQEQAQQIDAFLERSALLIESMKQRRSGKPVRSSWRLIRKGREERFKAL